MNFLTIKTIFNHVLNCAKMYLTSLIGWFTYPQHSISVVRLYIRKSAYIFSKIIYLNASKRIQLKITLFGFNRKTLLCSRFSMNFPLNRENPFKGRNTHYSVICSVWCVWKQVAAIFIHGSYFFSFIHYISALIYLTKQNRYQNSQMIY